VSGRAKKSRSLVSVKTSLTDNLQAHISVTYAGREASAAPAVGKFHVHIEQQKAVVQSALYGKSSGK